MTTSKLKELRDSVAFMAVEPPWCTTVETLKKWTEGFEQCQTNVLILLDKMIESFAGERE